MLQVISGMRDFYEPSTSEKESLESEKKNSRREISEVMTQ